MGENKSKQLNEVLSALNSLSPSDVFNLAADKVDASQESIEQQVADAIEFEHPYISELSQKFTTTIAPILQSLLLSASQQALEKGHQAAMVQHQNDEDEHIQQLETQLAEVKKKASQLELDNQSLEDTISEKEAALLKVTEELNRQSEEQYGEFSEKITQLTESLETAELHLNKQKEQNEAQSNKLKQLIEERRAEHQNQDQKLVEVKKVFTDEIEMLKQESVNKDDVIAELKQQLDKLSGELNSIHQQHESFSQEANKDSETLRSMLEDKEKSLQQFEKEKAELESQVKDQNEIVGKLEEQNKLLSSDIEEHKEQVSELSEKLADISKESEGRFNDLKKDLTQESSALKEKVKAHADALSEETAKNQELLEKLSLLENAKQDDQDLISQLRRQLEAQDTALNREQGRNSSLLSRIEKDTQQARGAYESIRSENISLNDRVEELEAKVTEFKLKFEYAQKQLNQ